MLYLASASPRRRELLTQAGFSFSVLPTNADESLPAGVTPREAVGILAVRMEEYRRQTAPGDVILAADTVVDLGGTIFGKPDSREDAARMLRALSGKRHSVHTGFCVLAGEKRLCGVESTSVEFYPLTDGEIADYLETGEPMDKAGAYGIQGRGVILVRRISGDYSNVVGLPVARVGRILRALGV